LYKSPIIETTLPELAKVDIYFNSFFLLTFLNVPQLDLMPLQNLFVLPLNGRRGEHAQEELAVSVNEVVKVSEDVYFEMHADAPDDWFEGLLQLPVHAVVEHVEHYHGLVSD